MTIRATLKTYFKTGRYPTQAQFYELLDAVLIKADDAYAGGSVLYGSTVPDGTIGADGDIYLRLQGDVYLRTSGSWSVAGSFTFKAHEASTSNPHSTTLEQARTAGNTFAGAINMGGHKINNLPTPTSSFEPATKGYADSLIDNSLKQPEAYNPTATGKYPTTYHGNVIQAGDSFRITAAQVDIGAPGVSVNIEDLVIALQDNPGSSTHAHWIVLESNRDQASDSVKGVTRYADDSEAYDGTSRETAMTPMGVSILLAALLAENTSVDGVWEFNNSFKIAGEPDSILVADSTHGVQCIAIPDEHFLYRTSSDPSGWATMLRPIPQYASFKVGSMITMATPDTAQAITGFDYTLSESSYLYSSSSDGIIMPFIGGVFLVSASFSLSLDVAPQTVHFGVSVDGSNTQIVDVTILGADSGNISFTAHAYAGAGDAICVTAWTDSGNVYIETGVFTVNKID